MLVFVLVFIGQLSSGRFDRSFKTVALVRCFCRLTIPISGISFQFAGFRFCFCVWFLLSGTAFGRANRRVSRSSRPTILLMSRILSIASLSPNRIRFTGRANLPVSHSSSPAILLISHIRSIASRSPNRNHISGRANLPVSRHL